MNQNTKSFFTVAAGKKYLNFAFQLARSYRLWNMPGAYPFFIVSNKDFKLPKDLQWVEKKIVAPALLGASLEFKLNLNTLSPSNTAIFIDSDCLIYGNIQFFFDSFKCHSVNVIGLKITTGEWADLNIENTLTEKNLKYLIRYNGGLYYIQKSLQSDEIFKAAKDLFQFKDKFQKHSSGINEEPIMSIAMSTYNVEPIYDDGSVMGDLVHFTYESKFNILKTKPVLKNPAQGKALNKSWMLEGLYTPGIIHFGSGMYNKSPYLQDRVRLFLFCNLKASKFLSNLITNMGVSFPYLVLKKIKKIF